MNVKFAKLPSIKFSQNRSSRYRVISRVQTVGRTDFNECSTALQTHLKIYITLLPHFPQQINPHSTLQNLLVFS